MLALIADVFTSKSEAEKRRLQEQISRNVLCLITMIHIFIAGRFTKNKNRPENGAVENLINRQSIG